MVQILFLVFTIIVGLLTAGAGFYVLYLLFREKGAGHAILGFFFAPYAYVWGWMNAKRLEIMDVMGFWTALAVIAIVFPVVITAQGAAIIADEINSGDITVTQEDGPFTISSEPSLALGSEDAVHMGTIDVGGRVTGGIDDVFAVHDWTFTGRAGQMVTVRANAIAGDGTDPRINLIGPGGELLTGDDDSGADMNAIIDSYTLPTDGEYTIQLDVWQSGRYEIRLD